MVRSDKVIGGHVSSRITSRGRVAKIGDASGAAGEKERIGRNRDTRGSWESDGER